MRTKCRTLFNKLLYTLMISTLRNAIFLTVLIYSNFSYAYSKAEIPYLVKQFEKESYETEEAPYAFSVSLPSTYEGWRLDVVFYRIEK